MGTTLETLEIQFRADTSAFREQLTALNAQLLLTNMAALAANAGLTGLAAAGFRTVTAAAQAAVPQLRAAGQQSGQALTQGLAAGLAGSAGQARSAGRAAGDGFAGGLRASSSSVIAAANSLASLAAARLRSALKIHSPSKVTRGLGAFAGEGFALGLGDSLRAVERQAEAISRTAAAGLSGAGAGWAGGLELPGGAQGLPEGPLPAAQGEALVQAVQAAVRAAMDSLEIAVPLNVDGIRLGEASIRGINAVTRKTGRMQLEI